MQDSSALVDLYDSTGGANWVNNTNWLTAAPVSSWHGITIINNRVRSIRLDYNNITGILPASLGNLDSLTYLNLSHNPVSGSIPAELGDLSILHDLYFNNDQLSGSIPAEFGNLSKLQYLRLDSNELSGSIPAQLGNLTNLQYLVLDTNQLSGSIPPALGNLTNLLELTLYNNQLSGNIPPALGNLTKVQILYLDGNQLSGSIPAELGNLSNLQYLTLYNNQLSGSIPPKLGNLSNLLFLDVDGNQLSGSIPTELGNLSKLLYLALDGNQLTGSIPSELGNLSKLNILFLNSNDLSGSIPSQIGNLTNLQNLSIGANQLSGSIPPQLGNLTNLQTLAFGENQLSGSIPAQLGNLTNLQFLAFRYNQLSGSIPAKLGNLTKLQTLYFNDNELSGSIPSGLGNLKNLQTLTLDSNQFTFNGLEPLVQKFNSINTFQYAPQDTIPLHYNDSTLSVSAGGTLANDSFHWYRNGTLYKTTAGDSTLMITQTGIYYVAVTNSVATELTLYSDTLDITTLPVNLLSFTAQKQNNTTLLQWQTANEINNNYFSVERSLDSKIFNAIGNVQAHDNTLKSNYSFVDNAPLTAMNYYRLKQVDNDGKFTYSGIVSVDFSKNNNASFTISPNPAKDFINITSSGNVANAEVTITDMNGRKLYSAKHNFTTGEQINIPASQFAKQILLITINTDNNKQQFKVVKE